MAFASPWELFGSVAIGVAVIGSLCYRAVASYVLDNWGRSTKGVVMRSVETNDDGSVVYAVSYEFTVASAAGRPFVQKGAQTTRYDFRDKDIVAVRYWPRWPRLNQIVDRAV